MIQYSRAALSSVEFGVVMEVLMCGKSFNLLLELDGIFDHLGKYVSDVVGAGYSFELDNASFHQVIDEVCRERNVFSL